MIKIKTSLSSNDNYIEPYDSNLCFKKTIRENYIGNHITPNIPEQRLIFSTRVFYDQLEYIVKFLEGETFIKRLKEKVEKRDKYQEELMIYEHRLGSEYWDSDKLVRPTRPSFKRTQFIDKENSIKIDFDFEDGYAPKLLEYIQQYCITNKPFMLHYQDDKNVGLILLEIDVKINELSQYSIEKELYFEFIIDGLMEVLI